MHRSISGGIRLLVFVLIGLLGALTMPVGATAFDLECNYEAITTLDQMTILDLVTFVVTSPVVVDMQEQRLVQLNDFAPRRRNGLNDFNVEPGLSSFDNASGAGVGLSS